MFNLRLTAPTTITGVTPMKPNRHHLHSSSVTLSRHLITRYASDTHDGVEVYLHPFLTSAAEDIKATASRRLRFTVWEQPPVPSALENGRVQEPPVSSALENGWVQEPPVPSALENGWVQEPPVSSALQNGWVQEPPVPSALQNGWVQEPPVPSSLQTWWVQEPRYLLNHYASYLVVRGLVGLWADPDGGWKIKNYRYRGDLRSPWYYTAYCG